MVELPPIETITAEDREAMAEAAMRVVETAQDLAGRGENVVNLLTRETDEFFEWRHYPKGDVFNKKTASQFYYHSHNGAANEHGHFHTFIRARGLPEGLEPVPHEGEDAKDWPSGKDTIAHLIAISMDHHGIPTHLFSTNRWVTKETFFRAEDVISLLPRFEMAENGPAPEASRWISSMMVLFRPQIEQLLVLRDEAIEARRRQIEGSGKDVFEDRRVELTSICEISVLEQLEWLGLLDD